MSSDTIRPDYQADGSGSSTVRTTSCDPWRAAIALHGEVDIATASDLRAELTRHLDAGRRVLRIDADAVTFIDSTAIGELVDASKRCHDAHGSLILTNVPARVRQIIKIAGLEGVLLVGGVSPSSTTS